MDADAIITEVSATSSAVRLLKLSKPVQEMVIDEKLSNGHARALLSIEDDDLFNKYN